MIKITAKQKMLLTISSILFSIFITLIDYFTEPEISLFYLIPVGLASWYISMEAGIIFSVLSACLWTVVNILLNSPAHITHTVFLWDTFVRLGFFIAYAITTSRLGQSIEREKNLRESTRLPKFPIAEIFWNT